MLIAENYDLRAATMTRARVDELTKHPDVVSYSVVEYGTVLRVIRRMTRHEVAANTCLIYSAGRRKRLLQQCHLWLFRAAGVHPRHLEPV